MVENLSEFFGKWIYVLIPFVTGLVTSFLVEAVNLTVKRLGTNWHPKWLVMVFSILIGFGLVLIFTEFYNGIIEFVFAFMVNAAVSVVFYERAGTWSVDRIFKSYKEKVDKRLE